ncbi:uncharacterized protein N7503_006664 [Penicillium pulvis]|uniref:uncharacterized protein n=1 Tax=Penicillium pulvis TaxID=1562058 RepID=UPI0025490C9D|nr:uncharacterized protein N7503_006664 [Penicillium pulvis]KAJ5797368.1 hypothetical protein N7503_006664 [Penicillium pulvis]
MAPSTPRSANACETCRKRKVKCTGEKPCRACVKHNLQCIFGTTGRRKYSEAEVKQLLEKIQIYEERLASVAEGPSLSSPRAPDPILSGSSRQHDAVMPGNPATPGNYLQRGQPPEALLYDESVDGISPGKYGFHVPSVADRLIAHKATDRTSGPAFESQVRSLLHRSKAYVSPTSGIYHNTHGSSEPVGWISVRGLVDNVDEPSIPSLEESQHLLDQFLYYLGVSQHFFDSRSFSDQMGLLFQTAESQEQQKQTTWYTEYLLVMAMAKLMDVEQPTSQPPGSELFSEALKRLPPLHHFGGEGVIVVEILTLVATYLQWCDRKHDAYIYIGLALRLAIALGYNLPENEQSCLPSQCAHRVRLWWTVYMLDRRLSSGLGLAAGADERQLRAGYPRHAVGFQSPVAITINVRIARITDEIMSSLYGSASITQIELVRKIQIILQELYGIGQSFPPSLAMDFSRPLERVTRTGSSLFLMLFQAIILCTRPILLRRVRLEVQRQQKSLPPEPVPEILARLCDTCHEASMRSLAILYNLQQQKTIPRYGFFDLDATFSAAFVLVMAGVLDNTEDQPPPALEQAFHVLKFLSQSGNSAAEQRFQDISLSCSHVWPNYVFNGAPLETQTSQVDPSRDQAPNVTSRKDLRRSPLEYPLASSTCMAQDSGQFRLDEGRLLESWSQSGAPETVFDMEVDWGLDLTGEAEGIYSSFHSPIFPLTGVDHMDWLEIEKVFSAPGV